MLYLKGDYSRENNAFEYFNMTDEMEKGQSWSRYDLNGYELQEANKEELDKVNAFLDKLAEPAREQAPADAPKEDYNDMPAWSTDNYKNFKEWAKACFDAGKKSQAKEIEVLREALKGVIRVADRKTDEFDKAKEALNHKP